MGADTDNLQATLGHLTDRRANFGCADVQSYDDAVFLGHDSLPIVAFLLRRQPPQAGHHLILETYIQGAESFLSSFPQCQYAIQPLQLSFPVSPAHVNRHRMSDRVDDQSVRRIEM